MTAKFWWSKGESEKKMHWISWEMLTEAKEVGRLRFRDLKAVNLALLGKQVWRLITKPNLLMVRVLKSKYFPKSDIFQTIPKPRDSWLWKSQNKAKLLIREGIIWKVGNGCSIKDWEDKWLSEGRLGKPFTLKPAGCQIVRVKDLMNQEDEIWNTELIKLTFSEAEVKAILRIPVNSMGSTSMEYYKKWSVYYCIRLQGCKAQENKQEKGDEGPSTRNDENEIKKSGI